MLRVLTPDGSKVILITFKARNTLRRWKLLLWNPDKNIQQISPDYPGLVKASFDFRNVSPGRLTASDPARIRTYAKKSGRIAPLVKFLGPDGNGPSHAVALRIRKSQAPR